MHIHHKSILALVALLLPLAAKPQMIDKVAAIVGSERILLSDIEEEYMRMKMQGAQTTELSKCQLLENMLTHKLLLNQAKIDSLECNPMNVENEMDRRLRYFISQMGSEQALEKYFNRSLYQIKDDLRESIAEQMLAQQMQQKIVEKVDLTPEEIKKFYAEIPQDSIPEVPLQYELQQIMIYPPASTEAKYAVRQKLLDIRERVLKGERFSTLAALYSEDRASAVRGGELGMRSRDEYVKEFSNAAFNLKEGQVSSVVETEFGFHLIQMIESKGNMANVRHILLKPQYTSDMMSEAIARLDSISTAIAADSITFERAAAKFSADKKSAMNQGVVINPYTGTTLFQKEQLEPSDYYIIRDLKEGQYSKPFESRDEHANVAVKMVKIKRIIPAHRANLDLDYDAIQRIAKSRAEQSILTQWVSKTLKKTYIKIDPEFQSCKFEMNGWIK